MILELDSKTNEKIECLFITDKEEVLQESIELSPALFEEEESHWQKYIANENMSAKIMMVSLNRSIFSKNRVKELAKKPEKAKDIASSTKSYKTPIKSPQKLASSLKKKKDVMNLVNQLKGSPLVERIIMKEEYIDYVQKEQKDVKDCLLLTRVNNDQAILPLESVGKSTKKTGKRLSKVMKDNYRNDQEEDPTSSQRMIDYLKRLVVYLDSKVTNYDFMQTENVRLTREIEDNLNQNNILVMTLEESSEKLQSLQDEISFLSEIKMKETKDLNASIMLQFLIFPSL